MERFEFLGVRRIFKAVVSVVVLSVLVATGVAWADEIGTITTVAGFRQDPSGPYIYYNGDEIPATQASIVTSCNISVDGNNNIYLCQKYSSNGSSPRIRKIDSSGIIHAFAGNGQYNYFPAPPLYNVPATSTWIAYPYSASVGPDGLLYENGFRSISKIDNQGIIRKVMGPYDYFCQYAYCGTLLDLIMENQQRFIFDSAGNIYIVVGSIRGKIYKLSLYNDTIVHIAGNWGLWLQWRWNTGNSSLFK